ncbi:MAG: Holliday junction branch migration protein RuvA [Micrococcales bacterium]
MIASLTGLIQRVGAGFVVLDVGGVGYQVFVPTGTAGSLHIGDGVLLHTALIVREDAFILFGFTDAEELELFDLLRSVTGVGPKLAMAIISQSSVGAIRDAVLTENDATFKSVSGIGPKTAKLIVVTLAGKLSGFRVSQETKARQTSRIDLTAVVEALQGLGWAERQAAEAVREVAESLGESATADTLLRGALARLGSGRSVSGGDK